MRRPAYQLGIDIGSTTAKIALLDAERNLRYSTYRRHNAETIDTLLEALCDARDELGNIPVELQITGSAGMGVSEMYEIPFIQEVVSSAEVVKRLYPDVKTLVDIGGEDAKMIFFHEEGVPDIRMNGSCAGGTGAFIDQMATLLNTSVAELGVLALEAEKVYPIASRCGVFAKTDVQNLLSRQVSHEDIAASIFHAVALQVTATLSRGNEPNPQLLMCGGPLTFLPALRSAFMDVLQLEPRQILNAEHSELLPAMGAAFSANGSSLHTNLSDLISRFEQAPIHAFSSDSRLDPLFKSKEDFQQWEFTRNQNKVPRADLNEVAGEAVFLGVDSGSTTTKLTLTDVDGRLLYSFYTGNDGDAIGATKAGLDELRTLFRKLENPPKIMRTVVTGYGEDLIHAVFGFDVGMVETLAHFRAARAFDPQVSFILDIGGQDMKAIYVQDGHIQNIELNEACSSGCGSFIETFARSMGYSVADFAKRATSAQSPSDLGTRCTVFMNSKVKQSLREGASVNDISAGLAYSVIKNALHKVLKITNTDVLGDHILVQGGTFRNPAVHKAMETLLEKPVLCPDISELMGAYGAALFGRDEYLETRDSHTTFIGLEAIDTAGDYEKKVINCHGCENRCEVTKLKFPNGRTFYTGNRCERIFSNSGKKVTKGADLTEFKYRLLFDRQKLPETEPRQKVGVPRTLNMYENYPFWNKLFVESGFEVVLSDPSDNDIYARGAGTIMSENICFPAKLTHGHIYNLIEKGVDRIFYPMVIFEQKEFSDALNSFNCPIVSGYPDVIRSAINPQKNFDVPLDSPDITFRDRKALKKIILEYLGGLGVDKKTIERAYKLAWKAQDAYKDAVRAEGDHILAKAKEEDRLVILLLGRPYHVDPLINHGVPSALTDFGVDVITEDSLHIDRNAKLDDPHVLTQWEYPNRYYHAIRWAGKQENVEVVQLNSFGCGPDAIAVDEVHSLATEYGMGHTVIRIDEIESTGSVRLRLRSMIESVQQKRRREKRVYTPRRSVRIYEKEDRDKIILVPQFSHFYTAPLVRPVWDMGYKMIMLPPPDRETAEVGLKYTNNEICYPAIIVIGDLIKALQSGKYDPKDVVVGITQTGGQCRASSYLSLLRRALASAGFYDTPIISLTTGLKALNEQPGFKFDIKTYAFHAVLSIAYADVLSELYYATAIRELNKGDALKVADKYMALLAHPVEEGGMALKRDAVMETIREAIAEFNTIPVDDREYPKVGVIGEIYAKYNSFSNNHVAQWLMEQGLEVVSPSLTEFFAAWPISAEASVSHHLKKPDMMWFLSKYAQRVTQSIQDEINTLMQAFPFHRRIHSIQHIADKANGIVHLTHQYGEGWLIPGEIGSMMDDDIPNILCLQPFGCIANHVIAKGVEKRMKEEHPDLNLLFLDVDAGVSEVNFVNRLHFFTSHAKHQESDPEIIAALARDPEPASVEEALCLTDDDLTCATCNLDGETCPLLKEMQTHAIDNLIYTH